MVEYSDMKLPLEKLVDENLELSKFVVQVVLEVLDCDWNWYWPAILVP